MASMSFGVVSEGVLSNPHAKETQIAPTTGLRKPKSLSQCFFANANVREVAILSALIYVRLFDWTRT